MLPAHDLGAPDHHLLNDTTRAPFSIVNDTGIPLRYFQERPRPHKTSSELHANAAEKAVDSSSAHLSADADGWVARLSLYRSAGTRLYG